MSTWNFIHWYIAPACMVNAPCSEWYVWQTQRLWPWPTLSAQPYPLKLFLTSLDRNSPSSLYIIIVLVSWSRHASLIKHKEFTIPIIKKQRNGGKRTIWIWKQDWYCCQGIHSSPEHRSGDVLAGYRGDKPEGRRHSEWPSVFNTTMNVQAEFRVSAEFYDALYAVLFLHF